MATQVQPPLTETEVTMLFLSTLQEPYYDRLMPTATGSFDNMVKAGNLINHAIKNGKIDTGESSSKSKGKTHYSALSNQTSTIVPHYTPSNNQATPIQTHLSASNSQNPSPQINYPTNK